VSNDNLGLPTLATGQADAADVLCIWPEPSRLLDHLADAVVVADGTGSIRWVNQAASRLLTTAPMTLVGRPLSTLVPARFVAAHEAAFRRFASTGQLALEGRPLQVALPQDDGSQLPVEIVISAFGSPADPDFGAVATLRAIAARTSPPGAAPEQAVEEQRAALLGELATAHRAQRFLLDASDVLARVSGFAEILSSLASVAVPTLGDLCLIDVVDERGRLTRTAAVHSDPTRAALVAELRSNYPPDPVGEHPGARSIQDGSSRRSVDITEQFLRETTLDERHFQIVTELGFTSYMAVPLVAEGQTLGAVTLVSAGSGRRFGPEDLALAEELAGRVALVIAKERRFDRERATSHTLQTSLLAGDPPVVPGLQLAVRYLPTTVDAQVGGDFWDLTVMSTGELAVAVGDVAGHDITAAATMAQLRSACRAMRSQTNGPDELIRLVHDAWDQLALDRMATAVFARLHPRTGRLRIATAGHPPPLILSGGTAWYPEVSPSSPFGAPVTPVTATALQLPAKSTLVFFTDGLVEDRNRDFDEGLQLLANAALAGPQQDAEELADHLIAAMSGEDRSDDIALLVVRRTAP
jgi:PAS domain S-box-containing protein